MYYISLKGEGALTSDKQLVTSNRTYMKITVAHASSMETEATMPMRKNMRSIW